MEIWHTLLIAMVSVVVGGLLTWIIGKYLGEIQQKELLKKLQDAVIDREHVSVNEELLMTQLLAEKIRDTNFKPDVIFAICPGGAMISEWLSQRFLGNRSAPIPVQLLYMRPEQKNSIAQTHMVEVDKNLTAISSFLPENPNALLVNDISRGGHTLYSACEFLKKKFPEGDIRSATLICHKDANAKPDYSVAMTKKAIRFDWKSYEPSEVPGSVL